MCREGIDLPITTAAANVTSCLCSPDVLNNKAQSSKTCCAFYILKRRKLRLDVKVSDLIYKNQIDIVIHKVIKVSLNGDTVINSTQNKVIYY